MFLLRTLSDALAVLLILSSGAAVANNKPVRPETNQPKEYVVALRPDKNPEAMVRERKSLEQFLSQRLKHPVRVIVPLSSAVIHEGLRQGQIDVAYLSGMEAHMAQKNGSAELFLVNEIAGRRDYDSYWLVKKDSPLKSVSDLKGKPVAFSSRTSTSGYLIPLADLVNQKLLSTGGKPEQFFGERNVFFGTGYVSAVEKVLQGEAVAAAVSDYVFLKDKHLTPEQKAQLRVLAKQGPVPTHGLVMRKSLPAGVRQSIELAFLSLAGADQGLQKQIFTAGFKNVEDPGRHVGTIARALEQTGLSFE